MTSSADPMSAWLTGFEGRMAEIQEKAAALQQNIAAAGATASTSDGGVRVTVGPSGALENLQLGPSTTRHPPAELAALIMRTAAQAQREAALKVAAAFAPMGEGTDAMDMLQQSLLPTQEVASDVPADGLAAEDDQQDEQQPTHRPASGGPRGRRPTSSDDDGDEGDDEQRPW